MNADARTPRPQYDGAGEGAAAVSGAPRGPAVDAVPVRVAVFWARTPRLRLRRWGWVIYRPGPGVVELCSAPILLRTPAAAEAEGRDVVAMYPAADWAE